VKITTRTNVERYRMRKSETYRGDYVLNWTRRIGGKTFDFSRVRWGTGETTLRVFAGGTCNVLHEFTA
jgi:hypothetical protein